MNSEWWLALGGVLLSGLLTSISPCPLATNIAAISYIGRKVTRTREVLLSGLLYTAGRALAYAVLAFLILSLVLFSSEQLTRFFSQVIHGYIGPIMILIGMILMGMISFSFGGTDNAKMQKLVDTLGLWSALPLGVLFALAFCPTSAAMFIATISLSANVKSTILLPTVYGIATALPVIVFAVIIAFQAQWIGKTFQVFTKIDWWMRHATGTLFIAVGIWFSLRYVYDVF